MPTKISNKLSPVFVLGTVARGSILSDDVVYVEADGEVTTFTRDMMQSPYENNRSFFSVMASGKWKELRPPDNKPHSDDEKYVMPELEDKSRIYKIVLPESDREGIRFTRFWQRRGQLPEGMDVLQQSITKIEAKALSMFKLRYEVKHVYPVREDARMNPTLKNHLTPANLISTTATTEKLVKTVKQAAALGQKEGVNRIRFIGVEQFISAERNNLDKFGARFLYAVTPYICNSKLFLEIGANLRRREDELDGNLTFTAQDYIQKIITLGNREDNDQWEEFWDPDQWNFTLELLALENDDAPTAEELAEMIEITPSFDEKARAKILMRIMAKRGTLADQVAFITALGTSKSDISAVIMQSTNNAELREKLLSDMMCPHAHENIPLATLGAICVAMQPTFGELRGDETALVYLKRISESWSTALAGDTNVALRQPFNRFKAAIKARRDTEDDPNPYLGA